MEENEEISRLIQETLRIYAASVAGRQRSEESSCYPYGRVHDLSDRVPGLATLREVLELIPKEQKTSFIEACRRCPELVRIESDPAAFLRREDYNIWAAARRLVKYWEFRQEIFGDKAFLPMNLTGEGALGPDEVAALRTGFQAVLPPDNMGRPVLMLDFSRVSGFSEKTLERTSFFMRCVAAQSEVGQKYGYTGLAVYNDAFISMQGVLRRITRLLEEAFPISPSSIYMIRLQKKTFFQMLRSLDPYTQGLSKNLNLVVAETPVELCAKMEKHHLKPEGLPIAFGGKWSDQAFQEWIQKQSDLNPLESYTKLGLFPFVPETAHSPTAEMRSYKNASLDETEMDLFEAIDLFPDDVKSAYLEAMELCPDLVRKESNPKKFLICEANDPTAAARRLVQYWELRRDLFESRAFRPMDATGKGVLAKDEVARLDRGFLRLLPVDVQGRPVVWWDRSKMTAVRSFEEVLRWWFYIFSVAAEDPVTQEKGILFMAVYKPDVYKTPIRQSSKSDVTQMVTKAIPFATPDVHVIALRPEGETLDPKLFNIFIERIGRNATTVIAPSPSEIADQLMDSGLTKAGIPSDYGGEWQRASDLAWRKQRDILENGRYLAVASKPSGIINRHKKALFMANSATPSGSGAEELVLKSIHALPASETSDYVEATRLYPDLVAQETDLARYLVVDKGDTSASAHKIARYWRTKKELCGNKFIYPIDNSPESAIPPMDARCLSDGTMVRLIGADPSGQDALYIEDKCKNSTDWGLSLFFALHVISSVAISKQGAFAVIVRATEPELYISVIKGVVEFAESVFPLRITQVHLLFQASDGDVHPAHSAWLHDLKTQTNDNLSTRLMFHLKSNEDDTLESLERMGFAPDPLSTVMGSHATKCDVNYLEQWMEVKKAGFAKSEGDGKLSAEHDVQKLQSALRALDEAIAMLPTEEKAQYLRAKEEAPAVVKSDSNPSLFLKFEKYNPWNTARRLTTYWKRRCQCFKERAFLPLNQTGEGALSKKDITLLSTGYVAFLPTDNEGRTVICQDASRLTKKDATTRLRNMFYWNHVVLQNEVSVEKGIVLIVKLGKTPPMDNRKDMFELGKSAFPFTAHSIHVIPEIKKRSFLEESVPAFLDLFTTVLGSNKHVHICNDKRAIAERLRSHGLVTEGIPDSLGGGWSYEKFVIWQERRIRLEWDLPLGTLDETGASTAKPMSELTEEERVERKRRYNILHSRRKRRRDRVETEVLQRQVDALTEEHQELTEQNSKLEGLLARANQLVASMDNPAPADNFGAFDSAFDLGRTSAVPAQHRRQASVPSHQQVSVPANRQQANVHEDLSFPNDQLNPAPVGCQQDFRFINSQQHTAASVGPRDNFCFTNNQQPAAAVDTGGNFFGNQQTAASPGTNFQFPSALQQFLFNQANQTNAPGPMPNAPGPMPSASGPIPCSGMDMSSGMNLQMPNMLANNDQQFAPNPFFQGDQQLSGQNNNTSDAANDAHFPNPNQFFSFPGSF